MTNFPPPDYDSAVGAHLAPPAPPAPPTPTRSNGKRVLGVIAALALVLGPAIVGYQIGQNQDSSSNGSSAIANVPSNGSQSSNDPSASSGSGTSSSVDLDAIRDKVDDSIININTSLYTGGAAAGTGIIISSQGLALTNNHVILDSDAIRVEVAATGKTYGATVLGYNIVDDVALIQIENASGLKAADLSTSESLAIGDMIVALGNAGGKGGSPTVVSGAVIALDQSITASESNGSNTQTLSDLIQVDANIQSGDSGGPLVDADGAVVGMNAAASSRNGVGGFPSAGGQNEGYAIPIEKALAIAKKIVSKEGGDNIHVGANRATLGIGVPDDSASATRSGPSGGLGGNGGNGAAVSEITPDSGADKAGISEGSRITAIDGVAITTASGLMKQMVEYQPGDKVDVTWIDSSGASHHAPVTLGSGPPA